MIYYELRNWLIDQENEEKAFEIIERCIFSDINFPEQLANAVRELRQIGENEVADKLERGELKVPFLA